MARISIGDMITKIKTGMAVARSNIESMNVAFPAGYLNSVMGIGPDPLVTRRNQETRIQGEVATDFGLTLGVFNHIPDAAVVGPAGMAIATFAEQQVQEERDSIHARLTAIQHMNIILSNTLNSISESIRFSELRNHGR